MNRRSVLNFSKQTVLNLVYLLLGFPLGIAYFVILVTGLAVGFGLAVILWGLAIVALTAVVWWYLAAFERLQAIHLLKANVRPMRSDSLEGLTVAEKLVSHVKNPVTWTSLIYLFLKFPFGIASFIVLSVSGALIVSPFTYQRWEIQIANGDNFSYSIDTFREALLMAGIGLVIVLPLTILIVTGMAVGWKYFAMLMLGDHRRMDDEISEENGDSEPIEPQLEELPDTIEPSLPGLALRSHS